MGIKVNGIQIAGIGAPGKSAYDYAKEGGYPGTENEFKQLMAGPIPIAHGGTEATTAEQARKNLSAAAVMKLTQAEYDALPAIDPSTVYVITDAVSDVPKITRGSYIGTGTFGKDNPNTLNFPFEPKIVIVCDVGSDSGSGKNNLIMVNPASYTNTNPSDSRHKANLTWGEKSVSWWVNSSGVQNSVNVSLQGNVSGTTYYYTVIG